MYLKKIIIGLLAFLGFTTLQAENPPYASTQERVAVLDKCYKALAFGKLASSTKKLDSETYKEKIAYEKEYFEAFPEDYPTFKEIFLPEWGGGQGHILEDGPWHVRLFYRLNSIPPALYYDKYIHLALQAVPAESGTLLRSLEVLGKHLFRKLYYHTDLVLAALDKRNDEEILHIFDFIFKSRFPRMFQRKGVYRTLLERIQNSSNKVRKLPAILERLATYAEAEERTILLTEYYERLLNCTEEERARYEPLFLEAFPSSFTVFKELYGPHVKSLILDHQQDTRCMNTFANLTRVDPKLYCAKYLDFCLSGFKSKNMRAGYNEIFGVEGIFSHYTDTMMDLLSKISEQEIHAFLKFMVANSAFNIQKDKDNFYKELYPKINSKNPQLAKLFTKYYQGIAIG